MKVELGDIKLENTEESPGGTSEGRSVDDIVVRDRRNLVRHDIPGMEGSIFQDMGRSSVEVTIRGVIAGKNALDTIESIRSMYKKCKPVSFNSDVTAAAEVAQVLIRSLCVDRRAGSKDKYGYSMTLLEYVDPPADTGTGPRDAEAKGWADGIAQESTDKGGGPS